MIMNSGLWPASAISRSTTSSRGSTTTSDNNATRTTNNVAATRHYQCSRLPLGTSASNFTLPHATAVKNFAQLLRHVLAALRSKILKQSIRSDTGWVTRKPIQENLLVHESAGQDCWGPWLIPLSTSEGLGTWTKGSNKKTRNASHHALHYHVLWCDGTATSTKQKVLQISEATYKEFWTSLNIATDIKLAAALHAHFNCLKLHMSVGARWQNSHRSLEWWIFSILAAIFTLRERWAESKKVKLRAQNVCYSPDQYHRSMVSVWRLHLGDECILHSKFRISSNLRGHKNMIYPMAQKTKCAMQEFAFEAESKGKGKQRKIVGGWIWQTFAQRLNACSV